MTKDKGKVILEVDDTELEKEKEEKKTVRVLAFSLGDENYCIEIAQAKEVMKLSATTRVPNMPSFVVGIANLRGNIITVLDIRYFFGLERKEKKDEIIALITDVGRSSVGIMVDKIEDTIDIEEAAIQPPLSTLKGKLTGYTKGQVQVGKNILILLDLAKVLKNEEIENLRKGGRG